MFVNNEIYEFYSSGTSEPYDTDEMAREFLLQFSGQAFSEGQLLAFKFMEKKVLALTIKSLEGKNLLPTFFLSFLNHFFNDLQC